MCISFQLPSPEGWVVTCICCSPLWSVNPSAEMILWVNDSSPFLSMVQVLLLISKVDGSNVTRTPVGRVWTFAERLAELRVWLALVVTCTLDRSLEDFRCRWVEGKCRLSLRRTSPMVVSMDRLSRLPRPLSVRLSKLMFL